MRGRGRGFGSRGGGFPGRGDGKRGQGRGGTAGRSGNTRGRGKSFSKHSGKGRGSSRDTNNKEISFLKSKYSTIDNSEVKEFRDLPLSSKTKKGLFESGYTVPTKIQLETIGEALRGQDILGAAKTGSGKTLAFLIPLLECLFCNKWNFLHDGLGALVITPTRELALQIFETVRNVGRHHEFSVGLIIGGKDLKFERGRMGKMNIIICTPGRLLQHMDENPLFDCSALKVLVLDEADRCLDMGFEASMNAIIENLPKVRQTLLFSATQTTRVRDLARLSLKDPKYISAHENEKHRTPDGLNQSYIVCDQHDKMTMLWSFINSHIRHKILIFLSTCNQVRFTQEVLKQLYPRTTLLALHGKLHQLKRMEVYKTFCERDYAVLFATDLAARGLDFPEVHWVVQADCPEDVATYIHRAGRTARYHKGGESLLLLRPSEEPFAQKLIDARVPVNLIRVNPKHMFCPTSKLEAVLVRSPELKAAAQRAFVSYAKAVFLMKDKEVFNVSTIDTEQYARSLGLVVCPRIRFLKRHEKAQVKVAMKKEEENSTGEEEEQEEEREKSDEEILPNSTKEFDFYPNNEEGNSGKENSDDDLFTVKRVNHELDESQPIIPIEEIKENKNKKKKVSAIALAKRALKKKIKLNQKIIFDEEGEAIIDKKKEKLSEAARQYEMAEGEDGGIDIEAALQVLQEEDKWDKKLYREKQREKRRELKRSMREKLGLPPKKKKKEETEGEKDEEEEVEESSSGSEPDLSWLPDPDKVYNDDSNQEEGEDEDRDEGDDAEMEENDDYVKLRRQRSHRDVQVAPYSSSEEDNVSLRDEEELALELLKAKR